jgi:hypothetical protein
MTDVGMQSLKKLENLAFLDICSSQITDLGLKELRDLKGLGEIQMQSCSHVTDVGLMELKDLPKLRRIYAYGSKITNTGSQELRAALPNVKISR